MRSGVPRGEFAVTSVIGRPFRAKTSLPLSEVARVPLRIREKMPARSPAREVRGRNRPRNL